MIKIKHVVGADIYDSTVSDLITAGYDNDTLIYDESTNELFRFIKPVDTSQTFNTWKVKLPKITITGVSTVNRDLAALADSYGLFDQDELFNSELTSQFSLTTNVYWQKRIGGGGHDYGTSILADTIGNVYINGYQQSDATGNYDYGVVKLSQTDGSLIWQKKVGGANTDYGFDITCDGSGYVYLCGSQKSETTYESFGIVKLNSNGANWWQKKIGGITAQDGLGGNGMGSKMIFSNASSTLFIVGQEKSEVPAGNPNIAVISLSAANGGVNWQKKFGGVGWDIGTGVALDSSNNVFVVGRGTSDTAGGYDIIVLKLNYTDGSVIWKKKIGNTGNDQGNGIAIDSADNVLIACSQDTDTTSANFNSAMGVIKLNGSDGSMVWQKRIGGGAVNDYGNAIAVDSGNNVYLVGGQKSGTDYDYGIIKFDTTGGLLWQKKIGATGDDHAYGIAVDSSDKLYIVGKQGSDSIGGYDYGVMKLDSTQPSDMSMTIVDMTLGISDATLTDEAMTLPISDMTLTVDDMSLTVTETNISGDVGAGLEYTG